MRDEQSQLFAYALRLLGRREYARMELQQKLTQWLARRSSLAAETEGRVTSLLEQLTAEGLQDDDRFAASYVRLCIMKGWGPIKISYHLRRKGIQEEKIKEHCERGEEFWVEHIRQLIERKQRARREREKNYRFLLGRGFLPEQIKQALR